MITRHTARRSAAALTLLAVVFPPAAAAAEVAVIKSTEALAWRPRAELVINKRIADRLDIDVPPEALQSAGKVF